MNWRQKVNRRLVVIRSAEPPADANVHYPELGLAVLRLPVDRILAAPPEGPVIVPDWLGQAIGAAV